MKLDAAINAQCQRLTAITERAAEAWENCEETIALIRAYAGQLTALTREYTYQESVFQLCKSDFQRDMGELHRMAERAGRRVMFDLQFPHGGHMLVDAGTGRPELPNIPDVTPDTIIVKARIEAFNHLKTEDFMRAVMI